MLLAPHFLVGAAIATHTPYAPFGLVLAFLSHYLFDQVPHWHYFPDTEKAGPAHPLKKPLFESGLRGAAPLLRVAIDITLGVALTLGAQPNNRSLALLAGFLAMLPDGLLFLSWQFPQKRLLAWHEYIHNALHITPRNAPALPIGVPLQTMTALIALYGLVM